MCRNGSRLYHSGWAISAESMSTGFYSGCVMSTRFYSGWAMSIESYSEQAMNIEFYSEWAMSGDKEITNADFEHNYFHIATLYDNSV